MYYDGKVSPGFNVHDLRAVSFIASKQDQSDVLYFHSTKGKFSILNSKTKISCRRRISPIDCWILPELCST